MLYVVGTPIGNLDDLSYRASKALTESDIILTEDTRSTGILLNRIQGLFNLTPKPDYRLISYYKEKEFDKLPMVLELLKDEKIVSLISEAGMPLISDPGSLLMKHVIREDLPYTVIPGPSAVTTALLHSGFKAEKWMFIGFLPKKENDMKKELNKIKKIKEIDKEIVFIAFESPNRIKDTLHIINEILPGSDVVVTRELTKKFEEVVRGKASELSTRDYRGEITLLIS